MSARWTWMVALALTGCSAEIEVQTHPVDLEIPVTSVGVDGYAELAIRIPEEARGEITVQSLQGLTSVVNPTGASMQFQLYVLAEGAQGTAEPDGVPFLFTEANIPAYFTGAHALVPLTTFAANSTTEASIGNPALIPLLQQEVIWLVAANTVTSVGLGTTFPLELQLNDLSFNIVVTKSFETSAGGMELLGL